SRLRRTCLTADPQLILFIIVKADALPEQRAGELPGGNEIMQLLFSRCRKAPVAFATVLFASGLGLLGTGSAQSIGGLCNGQPASHTWLDASGQPGPTLFDG